MNEFSYKIAQVIIFCRKSLAVDLLMNQIDLHGLKQDNRFDLGRLLWYHHSFGVFSTSLHFFLPVVLSSMHLFHLFGGIWSGVRTEEGSQQQVQGEKLLGLSASTLCMDAGGRWKSGRLEWQKELQTEGSLLQVKYLLGKKVMLFKYAKYCWNLTLCSCHYQS